METRQLAKPSPPYLAAAISHPTTYLIAVGTAVVVFLAGTWWPILAGVAAEVAWLARAYTSRAFRRKVDAKLEGEAKKAHTARQQEVVRTLGEDDRRRFLELDRLRAEIHKLCAENTNVTLSMVQGELDKLDNLIASYLKIASAMARYEAYVASNDLNDLEQDIRRQEALVEKADAESKELARRNLEVLERRAQKATEIRRQLKAARGQLHLIENTVRLLRDQVVTMESPVEIARELDELSASVSAIEASGRETEALLGAPRALPETTSR